MEWIDLQMETTRSDSERLQAKTAMQQARQRDKLTRENNKKVAAQSLALSFRKAAPVLYAIPDHARDVIVAAMELVAMDQAPSSDECFYRLIEPFYRGILWSWGLFDALSPSQAAGAGVEAMVEAMMRYEKTCYEARRESNRHRAHKYRSRLEVLVLLIKSSAVDFRSYPRICTWVQKAQESVHAGITSSAYEEATGHESVDLLSNGEADETAMQGQELISDSLERVNASDDLTSRADYNVILDSRKFADTSNDGVSHVTVDDTCTRWTLVAHDQPQQAEKTDSLTVKTPVPHTDVGQLALVSRSQLDNLEHGTTHANSRAEGTAASGQDSHVLLEQQPRSSLSSLEGEQRTAQKRTASHQGSIKVPIKRRRIQQDATTIFLHDTAVEAPPWRSPNSSEYAFSRMRSALDSFATACNVMFWGEAKRQWG